MSRRRKRKGPYWSSVTSVTVIQNGSGAGNRDRTSAISVPGMATTIVSSSLLSKIAAEHHVSFAETLTGFKWVSRAASPGHPLILGYAEALGLSSPT